MNRSILGRIIAMPAATAIAIGLASCGAANEQSGGDSGSGLSGTLNGAGSSAQEAAQQTWIAGFTSENPDATINYDPIGSGGGVEQFIAGGTDFAGSDSPFEGEEIEKAKERCGGEFVEVPTYVSPVAVIFNLDGVGELNLKPDTIAKIFNQKITKWNDPEIKADNPGVKLPDLKITPVNRSDESGTTENFVEYLSDVAGDAWPHEVSENWPVPGGEAAQGTSGVVQAVKGGNGTIGYADASQAKGLGTVKVGVGDEFVQYSPEAAAAVLDVSKRMEGRGKYSFAYDVARDTTEKGVYPIVLVSYAMACTSYEDPETAKLVKSYIEYQISEQGQQAAAKNAGSAPLSDKLREQITPAVEAISSGGQS